MSVAIAMMIGSPNSILPLVKTAIDSIMTNIGTKDYRLIIAMTPFIGEQMKNYVYTLKRNYPEAIDLMPEEDYYWADFINEAINRSTDCKYFIKSHDDIELLTPNFLTRVEDTLRNISEPVGWVSFTDKDYLNGNWAPSTRAGFYRDSIFENGWGRRKLFQFHALRENWWEPSLFRRLIYRGKNDLRWLLHYEPLPPSKRPREYYANLPYDFPSAAVKCHAPFSHFVLIEMEKLRQIGTCEKWSPIPLLIDEDWGLRALQLGLNNIWIPDIEYIHCRGPSGGTRAWPTIAKHQERVHKLFREKWGFLGEEAGELDFIRKEYKNTNIPWSIDRRSYEWDYIR